MPEIRKLDLSLVNKIAAGEVIERPASVVKELVENAVDAGARRIDIALEEGGCSLVRVSDDGCGIPGAQLALAVEAHATSKICSADDLFRIQTLGFRGEALASIAAVSHFRIVSRTPEQLEAYELRVAQGAGPIGPARAVSGEIQNPESIIRVATPCAGPLGTTVEVRNLFYNLPARRKFLRQPATELANATEQLARLALAHPAIAFSLAHNGRQSRSLPATTDRRGRIADFYGPELAECLIPVMRDERGLRIEALFAPPAQSRASTRWQYVFLNGRYINDRRIGYAIREAFRGLVEHDRFPVVFMFLTAPCDSYDVNVHPTKIEVRWRDAGLVQSQVLAVLRETLLARDLTPGLRLDRSAPARSPGSGEDPDRLAGTRQALADYLKSIDPTQARIHFEPPRFPTHNLRPSIASSYARPPAPSPGGSSPFQPGVSAPEIGMRNAEHGMDQPGATPAVGAIQNPESEVQKSQSAISIPPSAVLQVHNTYLVAQTDEGMVIIDQHALHERILYEQFRRRILAGPLESQRLLIPVTLEVSAAQARAADSHRPLLERLGVEVGAFGPGVLAVQSFPTLLPDLDVRAFVADLLDKLAEEDSARSEETLIHAALDLMACKAAVKAGDPLTLEEMQALLAQRQVTEKSSNCPHGRPTTLQLTTRDLEKQFKRV